MNNEILLEPLDHTNWYKIYDLSVSEEQKTFFPVSNIEWIGISRYEEKTELFAIKKDDVFVGLIGGGFDEDGVTGYVNPIMIDYRYQGNGYGKQAMILIIKYLQENLYVTKINIGHRKVNDVAGNLYKSLGFKIINDEGNDYYRQLDLNK